MNGPIIAYRSWSISGSKRQIKSTGHGTKAWARLSAPAAQCAATSDFASLYYYSIAQWMADLADVHGDGKPRPDDTEHHEAPAFKCKCGYYAMKRVEQIPTASVYGRVALWGHIIEHDHGYRAQYAYPQVFFAPPDASEKFMETLKGLAQQYGCEIAPMPQELADELAKRKREAEEARKRQSFWVMDDTIPTMKSGSAWSYTVHYDTGANAHAETQDKREKGFSPKTLSHPFKAFLGIDPAERRRKK